MKVKELKSKLLNANDELVIKLIDQDGNEADLAEVVIDETGISFCYEFAEDEEDDE